MCDECINDGSLLALPGVFWGLRSVFTVLRRPSHHAQSKQVETLEVGAKTGSQVGQEGEELMCQED